MTVRRGHNLNRLQHLLPEGLVVSAKWLEEQGYSRASLSSYVANGWLEQPARGAYRRPGGHLQWQQVVISLQALLGLPVVIGGRSALELQGFTHYVPASGARFIHLYCDKPLPGWVKNIDLDIEFISHRSSKLFGGGSITRDLQHSNWKLNGKDDAKLHATQGSLLRQSWGHWNWPLVMSTPERAMLELLDEVPDRETFHQADMLIESLRTLSPKRMQKLLEDCRNVKVKRLCLWFAERHGFAWLQQINREHINLGTGKRMLVKGGKLDAQYLITVPGDLDAI